MTEAEFTRMLDEIDRLVNDPDVTMDAGKVWSLLADVVEQDAAAASRRPNAGGCPPEMPSAGIQ